jgi:uncharacterized membrane protein
MRKNRQQILALTELSVLTAIVLILQLGGIALPLPFLATPVSLVLLPIALGAMKLGPGAGSFLGLVFGVITVIGGVSGRDAFTAYLFADHPVLTVLLCLAKAVLAGLACGLVYRLLQKKNEYLAIYTASIVTPIVNTGIFVLGALAMSGTIDGYVSKLTAEVDPSFEGMTAFYFVVVVCAGLNFVFELLINVLFAPALKRVLDIVTKNKKESAGTRA